MIHALIPIGAHFLRRSVESGNNGEGNDGQLPPWAGIVFLVNLVIILPLVIYVTYTLGTVYPTLAMVEMPAPPSYEAILSDDTVSGRPFTDADDEVSALNNGSPPKVPPKNHVATPVLGQSSAATPAGHEDTPLYTTSLRRVHRLLMSNSGWKSNFRGLGLSLLGGLVSTILVSFFSAILPVGAFFLGSLLASLLTVQLSTAWTHRVISADTAGTRTWLRKLQPFKKTLKATYIPILVQWAATFILAAPAEFVLAGTPPDFNWPARPDGPSHMQQVRDPLLFLLWALLVQVLIAYPAQVALIRVQASLLPAGEETIVPFDRTFGGQVVPMALGGDGYVGFSLALKTFSWSSWVRLYKLLGKIILVVVALEFVVIVALGIQIGVLSAIF